MLVRIHAEKRERVYTVGGNGNIILVSHFMYGCESWTLKKAEPWRFDSFSVVLEKTLESLLDSKEIKPVNPKGSQLWTFIWRTDTEAEAPKLWPPDAKSWFIWKDPDAGKDEGRRRRDDRGWDGWITSLPWWTWVWASSGSQWWTGNPGMLQSMELQSQTQLSNGTELNCKWFDSLAWGSGLQWAEWHWMLMPISSQFCLSNLCVTWANQVVYIL